MAKGYPSYRSIVAAQLRLDEGVRAKPYRDSVGKLTIGVGRNLDDVGLRSDEIAYLLDNDIKQARADARAVFRNFDRLSVVRRSVLVNMAFNLGRTRFATFIRLRAAVESRDFDQAAVEMLDSKWATQVGERAVRLAASMRSGK